MISQLMIGILAVFVSFLLVGYKRRRIWPILMLIVISILFFLYFNDISILAIKENAHFWLNYPHLQSKFTLTYNIDMLDSLSYILVSVWILLWINAFNHIDHHPLSAGNVQLLLLVAFIFMFSAQDFMQLMLGSCCFSIIGFYQINDNKAKTRFIFYSFVAEMAIFTALAIVYAKINQISLSSLTTYTKRGWHKDLVAILVLIGVFAKCGVFLFQNQLLDLQSLSFNRLLGAALLASPLSGLLLYFKLMPLIKVSSSSSPIIITIVVLTFMVSLFGMWWHNNIKNKILYFCMYFISLSLYCLHSDILTIYQIINLIPFVLIICCSLFISFYGCLRWVNILFALASIFVFVHQLLLIIPNNFILVGMMVSGLAVVLHEISFTKQDSVCLSLLSNLFDYLLLTIVGILFVLSAKYSFSLVLMIWLIVFAIIFFIIPQRFCNLLHSQEWFQEKDWISLLYHTLLVSPLRLLGRLLWILVDFILIERGVIGKISEYGSEGVLFLGKLQDTSVYNWLWLWLLGIILLLINIGRFAYE